MGQSTPVVTAEFYDHRKAFDYWGIYGSALIGGYRLTGPVKTSFKVIDFDNSALFLNNFNKK